MRTFFLLVLGGALALGQDLQVLRLSPPATVRPGDLAVQVWQVTNLSPSSLTVSLELGVPAGWEALGVPPTLVLGPGEEEYIFCALHVPRMAPSGTYPVRLRLRWNGQEVGSEAQIEVEAVAALELLPPSAQAGQPGEALEFSVQVVNRGNVVDRVEVSVRTASGWRVEVRPRALSLSPGEAGEVRLTVWIPEEAPVGREVVLAVARSALAPAAEARAAWSIAVLPPGPERVPVRIHAELAMEAFGRLGYDFLSESGTSFLGFSGRGAVLDGALELSARWAGPWAPTPYRFLDFQAVYAAEPWEVQVGRVGFSFPFLLSPLGFWGLTVRHTGSAEAAFGSGGEAERVRAGALVLLRSTGAEAGAAYREERGGGLHTQGGALRLGLQAGEHLWFRVDGGAARAHGLTRFAGQMSLTWEIPQLFFLEARAYAVDPGFPGLVRDRAGVLLSGRLGAPEAGFRFLAEWQRDNLRGLSLLTRAWQGIQAGWDLFPAAWPLRLGFSLALRRTADLSFPAGQDERVARAEAYGAFSLRGFALGAQAAFTRLEDPLIGQSWRRQELREWLELRPGERVLLRGEFRQVVWAAPGEELRQDEASFSFSWADQLRISWAYGREGGALRAEAALAPSSLLTLKLGAEARWRAAATPTQFSAFVEFAHRFSFAPPFLPVYGLVSGVVFADLNGNGVQDPGEPGLPGVVLALAGHQVSSGKDGLFRFPGQPPGTYTLQVVRAPAGYAAPVQEFAVALALGQEARLSIPLLPLSRLSGLVFVDLDADGVPGPGEPGLARAFVRLVPQEGEPLGVLTDALGRFSWPELRPGRYTVELVVESLPARHEPTTPASLALSLAPGEEGWVAFGVRERPRPVLVIQPPWAEFTWTPAVPVAGQPVLFDASLSQAFDAQIVQYLWDFDSDGVVDAEGLRASWVFPAPGAYLVTLAVVDSAGLSGRTQYLLQVRP